MPEGLPPELDHPYYQPGAMRFDNDFLVVATIQGVEIADRLEAGEVDLLPDTVTTWLTFHTSAINGQAPGIMRGRVAEQLAAPFTPAKAMHIGALMRETIWRSNKLAEDWRATPIGPR